MLQNSLIRNRLLSIALKCICTKVMEAHLVHLQGALSLDKGVSTLEYPHYTTKAERLWENYMQKLVSIFNST